MGIHALLLTGIPLRDGNGGIVRSGYPQFGEPATVWHDEEVILQGVAGSSRSVPEDIGGPVVVRALTEPGNVFRSWVLLRDLGTSMLLSNAGVRWQSEWLPAPRIRELAVDDAKPQHLIVVGESSVRIELFESLDGAHNWQRLPLSAEGVLQLGFLNGELAVLRDTGLWMGSRLVVSGGYRQLNDARQTSGEHVLVIGGDDGLTLVSPNGAKTLVDEPVVSLSVDRSAFAAVVASGAVVVGPVE